MTEPTPARFRRRWVLVAAAVLVLVGALVAAIALNGAGAAAPAASSSSPSPSPSVDAADSSPSPVPEPAGSTPAAPTPGAPVPLDQPAQLTEGVSVRLDKVEAVEGEASGPGETAGPALRFTVVLTNGTAQPLDMTRTVVTVDYGPDSTPASPLSGPGVATFPSAIGAGAEGTAVVVFDVPADQRDRVRVTVDHSVDTPVVVFEGSAPTS